MNLCSKYPDAMNNSHSLKKSKGSTCSESLLAILGLVLITAFFIGRFFFLDSRSVTPSSSSELPELSELKSASTETLGSSELPGFLNEGGERCNIFEGNWVWDESHPLYHSKNCPFIDEGYRCLENGRPDDFYTKWRWQPKDCDLPRFDAQNMLEKLRNQRVVFVGDSSRTQWESLLCMLSSAVPDKSSIYEVNGNPITMHNGFLVFMFQDYNCTLEYYRAPYLVVLRRPPPDAPQEVKLTVKVDELVWTSKLWSDADILIFNSGHWWTYEKTRIKQGIYFQEGQEVKMNMSVEAAFRRSIETLLDWIGTEVNTTKTQVFLRTFAPSRFRGGKWNSGGDNCQSQRLPEFGSLPDSFGEYFDIVSDVLSERSNEAQVKNLNLLNVTSMTARRKDGLAAFYNKTPDAEPSSTQIQDCRHWCLPGVPDSWNELLYALFLKKESVGL